MAKILLTSSLVCILFFTYYTPVFSQSPASAPASPVTPVFSQSPALAPAPAGHTNVVKILQKAGLYTTFVRLLKSTQMADQLNKELRNSDQGLTLFVPTDDAFNNLKTGMLNSLTDQQKFQLIRFHVLPSFYSAAQFQTATNPLTTQAQFPLNVTTIGNSVNITTDMVNTSIANTIYTDSQLAIYRVDKVLLPHSLFAPPPLAPAPLKPKKSPSPSSNDITPILISDGTRESRVALRAISSVFLILAVFCL